MKVQLRETKENDIPFVLVAEDDEANRLYVDHWDFSKHRDSLMESDIRHMIIERIEDQQPVGYTIMAGFSGKNRSAELKRLVVTEKGKGYGKEVLLSIENLVFNKLNFHRLWLDVRDYNIKAKKLYEKIGFSVEGHLRECVFVEDHFESIYIMGMLKNEYTDR
jgi:diamine N-acetyltransferase